MNKNGFYIHINPERIGNIVSQITKALTNFLLILFLALRAFDVIEWLWYLVLSPLLLPIVTGFVCLLVLLFINLINLIERKMKQ